VNLELDRARRVRSALEQSQHLLDEAERMARVGSWEIDLTTGAMSGSDELLRLLDRTRAELTGRTHQQLIEEVVHPEDRQDTVDLLERALTDGRLSTQARILLPSGVERLVRASGELVRDEQERPLRLRGFLQDITEQHRAEQAVAAARALEQSVAREHAIADELQRSLMPEQTFDLEHLDVATYYQAGVEGTQVGGDWYDVIELGAGRTAFVVGDVMGRGVSAAVVMGQLRSAVRAFAKLDLQPADLLEYLEGMVQDLGVDHIVTCVYAVFDSTDQVLRYANAGHLPPLLTSKDGKVIKLEGAGAPLGAGYFGFATEVVQLGRDATVTFYTDGLVERRDRDIDTGIEALSEQLSMQQALPLDELPETLVDALLPEGPDDDIAILVARVNADPYAAAVSHRLKADEPAVSNARRLVTDQLRGWSVPKDIADDVVLMSSELVTNAFVHGRPPIDLRLRLTSSELVLEVQDRTSYRPKRRRAQDEDENGRGLQIVSLLADRWGTRATVSGKSVWCTKAITRDGSGLSRRGQ
jgi:PAS domain S-box-containing protein